MPKNLERKQRVHRIVFIILQKGCTDIIISQWAINCEPIWMIYFNTNLIVRNMNKYFDMPTYLAGRIDMLNNSSINLEIIRWNIYQIWHTFFLSHTVCAQIETPSAHKDPNRPIWISYKCFRSWLVYRIKYFNRTY